jgi:hypothetical protein
MNIVSMSPDGHHKVVLGYLDEIRFGPAYYSLILDNIVFGKRVFGKSYVWSPDSHFLAIQEWETIHEGHGPRTHLLLVDVENQREGILSRVEKGFIRPQKFEQNKLIYVKEYPARSVTREFEMEFLSWNRWENLK